MTLLCASELLSCCCEASLLPPPGSLNKFSRRYFDRDFPAGVPKVAAGSEKASTFARRSDRGGERKPDINFSGGGKFARRRAAREEATVKVRLAHSVAAAAEEEKSLLLLTSRKGKTGEKRQSRPLCARKRPKTNATKDLKCLLRDDSRRRSKCAASSKLGKCNKRIEDDDASERDALDGMNSLLRLWSLAAFRQNGYCRRYDALLFGPIGAKCPVVSVAISEGQGRYSCQERQKVYNVEDVVPYIRTFPPP